MSRPNAAPASAEAQPGRWNLWLNSSEPMWFETYHKIVSELNAAEAEIQELKRQLAEEVQSLKEIEAANLPCGHHYRNAVSQDGGKTGYCNICDLKRQLSRLSQVNGKLVEALQGMRKRWGKNKWCSDPECTVCLDEIATTDAADAALAEAQKENK